MKNAFLFALLATASAATIAQGAASAPAAAAPAASAANTITTASGLQYTEIKAGTGASPAATDTVRAIYRGTFPDGKEFDNSKGKAIEFPLNRVIACWTEGLQLMKVGGKAKLVCPGAIAYGAKGMGKVIPPNATLHFDVELVGIQGK